jgi:peptidoglycan/LPS O-acetylase OafA/YrhL
MGPLYITHYNYTNLLNTEYVKDSLLKIIPLTFFIVVSTLKVKNDPDYILPFQDSFSKDSSLMFRGLAIILLIFGHLTQYCTEGMLSVLSYRITGSAAVMIFLMLSGIGIVKTYGLSDVGKGFLVNRFKKLYIPLWLVLTLFFLLNYYILKVKPSWETLVLNYIGILPSDLPAVPLWFITYILIQYFLYYIASQLPARNLFKIISLFIMCYFILVLILAFGLERYAFWWPQYMLVFPAGVLVGLYRHEIFKRLNSFYKSFPYIFILIMISILMYHYEGTGIYRITNLIHFKLYNYLMTATINPLSFIALFLMLFYLVENSKISSRLMCFIGQYSYEIFLLHLPFMVYYDMFFFRRPMVIFFYVYVSFVLLLGYQLQKISYTIESLLFTEGNN